MFYTILTQPLLNILVLIYNVFNNFGIAIIVLTLLIRFLLYPLSQAGIVSQKKLTAIQPKIKEVQEKYKDNKEEQTKRLMELYKENKVSPFSGCLPLLIQLPILFAIYRVFWTGFSKVPVPGLYSFVHSPHSINTMFLGMNLAHASIILAVVAALAQFIQSKMMLPKTLKAAGEEPAKKKDMAQAMNQQMLFMMPLFTFIFLLRLPSSLGIYWIVSTLFTIIQQWYILRFNKA